MGLDDNCYFGKVLSVKSNVSDRGRVFIVGFSLFHFMLERWVYL